MKSFQVNIPIGEKKKNLKTRFVGAAIDEEHYSKFKKIAYDHNLSVAGLIKVLIDQCLKQLK